MAPLFIMSNVGTIFYYGEVLCCVPALFYSTSSRRIRLLWCRRSLLSECSSINWKYYFFRRLLIEKIAYHIADFTPRLRGNNRALYQYCGIPTIRYQQLQSELFCNIYYLRHLCDVTRFPDWPIKDPVILIYILCGFGSQISLRNSGVKYIYTQNLTNLLKIRNKNHIPSVLETVIFIC